MDGIFENLIKSSEVLLLKLSIGIRSSKKKSDLKMKNYKKKEVIIYVVWVYQAVIEKDCSGEKAEGRWKMRENEGTKGGI